MSDSQSINLGDDNFVRSVIHRQVGKLIAKSDFTQQDRNDLVQEVYVRATKSLRLYDPSVGHLYPYVCTVVQRHLASGREYSHRITWSELESTNLCVAFEEFSPSALSGFRQAFVLLRVPPPADAFRRQ